MPRILRILNRLNTGGPAYNVLNLAKYLAPEYETLLLVGEKESHEGDASSLAAEMGIAPVIVPEMGRAIHPLKDFATYQKIKKIIKEFRPDIVHTHAAKPGAVGRLAAAACNVPVIVHTYHGHVFHSYFGKFKTSFFLNVERIMAKKSSALIAISKEQKKELSCDYKVAAEDKFEIIPLGFELDRFVTDQEKKRRLFRQEFELQENEIAIAIIGRLAPIKNHSLFLEGLAYCLQNTSKKIKAFIVGDGETRNAVEQLAQNLKIKYSYSGNEYDKYSSLVFTSWRKDMDVVNAGSDIICLTSLNEGTPVSLIEAQAAGKPIISTRVGGVQDVVIENETALLSDPNDSDSFARNLLRLVEDDQQRERMRGKGINWTLSRFSAQRLATDMNNLYTRLLHQGT